MLRIFSNRVLPLSAVAAAALALAPTGARLEFGHFERVTLGKFQSFQNTDGTQLRRGFVGQAAYIEQE
jgi:hypothetical protein